jgi:hypothetical protein
MQVKVPVDYRQSFKWVGSLDAVSLSLSGGGGLLAFHTILGSHMPWPQRIAVAALSAGLGAVLGLGRWPVEYGDSTRVWIRRFMEYRSRPHVHRAFRVLTPREAANVDAAYDSERQEG